MNYKKNVTVLIPSELLYAFDADQDNVFLAARERGMIVLRPLIISATKPYEVGKSDFQKGYLAGMRAGYDKGYSDALGDEDNTLVETVVDSNCTGFCLNCPHYDDLFDTCRFYSQ